MPNTLRTNPVPSRVPRRGAVALVTTVLAVLMLFSFKPNDLPSATTGLPTEALVGAAPTPTPISPPSEPTPSAGATPTPPPSQTTTAASGTYKGDAINTPYGTVQIALTVQNGQIVDVQDLQMPNDRRLSAQISQAVGPMLRDEVLQAQSANIMGVSGASYTSYGFYKSLQSALAQLP
jgi:uncharacterized protein with FMN-binding domain